MLLIYHKDILPIVSYPDKAIDLIDEACASIRMEIDSLPEELDGITREKNRLEMERISIEKRR